MSAGTTAAGPSWRGRRVLVCGIGVSGVSAARALARAGAAVTVVDERHGPDQQVSAAALESLGIAVRLGPAEVTADELGDADLVVTSPGWRPQHPLLRGAADRGVPIWGEVELAWQLGANRCPWLVVTGTNGKTTTTEMLAAMLAAAGLPGGAVGNIGTPILDTIEMRPEPVALAVELSSFQLHWSHSVRPAAAAILNLADDHLDWHGSFAAYAEAKAKAWPDGTVRIYNADDPRVVGLLGGRSAVGFTLEPARPGLLGVTDGWLVDLAFGTGRLLRVDELQVAGGHNVANALAAAALALSGGVPPDAVTGALRRFTSGPHRNVVVAEIDGVRYVDDSKATNPHAAAASLASYDRVVWIAGGLNKGMTFDDLVVRGRDRLAAAVLIGSCAEELRDVLARHAPHVPVFPAGDLQTAVEAARGVARPGDVVLLAPAAASMDMFTDYAARGAAFAAAVRALGGPR